MPLMTAREYQRLLCPACGERKLPEQPLCLCCQTREQARRSVCPRCQQAKPAHYALFADCQGETLMTCSKCGGRKLHPEQGLCPACYAERKHGRKAAVCACPCGCRNPKTKPRAPVCGLCWQAGHYHNQSDFSETPAE